mmetsp:Transcript_14098/g.21088  ORF Transcript_14098/g.21088 Transcript_14098/m.21088 type:complete len:99 (-) Transcript_14098:349-645(-)
MVVIAGALVMMTDTRDMTDIILEAEIVEAAVETGEATVKTGEAEVETGEAAVGIIEVEAEIAGAGVQCPGEGTLVFEMMEDMFMHERVATPLKYKASA